MTTLLDGNVLIALVVEEHTHHDIAVDWFDPKRPFATCPITQGTLLRFLLREGVAGADVGGVLETIVRQKRHEFWADDIGFGDVKLAAVQGHRQVTDAYLAQLAREHGGRLVTFDRALAALHGDVVDLLGA